MVLKDIAKSLAAARAGAGALPDDGLAGFAALLLNQPPSEAAPPQGGPERRTGLDRRTGDRRQRAREFNVNG